MFLYEDKTSYLIYTSEQTFEKYVDLLVLRNSKSSQYVLIKDCDRFITNKIMHHGKKHIFVDVAYNAFLVQKY